MFRRAVSERLPFFCQFPSSTTSCASSTRVHCYHSMLLLHSALLAALPLALAQTAPFANTSTPDSPLTNATSPPKYPSPWGSGLGDWAEAYQKAEAFVKQLTLLEKVNLTTGVGWESEKCVGNAGNLPRLGFKSLCLQDSPLGIRFADFASAFSSGRKSPKLPLACSQSDWRNRCDRGCDMGPQAVLPARLRHGHGAQAQGY